MKVRMLATRKGCEDGFTIKKFDADNEYEIHDGLASAFLAAGFAVPVRKHERTRKLRQRKSQRWAKPGKTVFSPLPNNKLSKLTLDKLRIKRNDT